MKKILFIFLSFAFLSTYSQELTAYQNTVTDGYNFWVYTPKADQSILSKKPLMIFLHGSSLCGNDLSKVRRYGCLDAIEMGRNIDAVIIAPQNPGGAWNPHKINNILIWAQENILFDTNRIYVIGMSLGGYGTIDFVGTYPEKIAAAMALCGGGTLKSYCGLNQVPLWLLHGTADRAVSDNQSEKIVSAMIDCGDTSLLRFTKLKGLNHSQLARVFYVEETYQWLFSHFRGERPSHVNKEILITPEILSTAYQNVDRSKGHISVKYLKGNNEISQKESANTAAYHKVKQGDTLYSIAKKHHTTISKLCKINRIKENGILSIGQKIKLR